MTHPYAAVASLRDRVAACAPQRYGAPAQALMPSSGCESLIGFLDSVVETATQTTITVTPQDAGLVTRLEATDSAEDTFQLDDFLNGRQTMLPAVPVSFASLKTDGSIKCMPQVSDFAPGKNLVLVATNFTGGSARLSANARYNSYGAQSSDVR